MLRVSSVTRRLNSKGSAVQLHIDFLVLPVVGAFIGALTNDIAIRMLFRPYRPVRLWGWRLPFTPGVIPMQRGIIAHNIAETFETYLFSGQEIHTFLTGERAQHAVEAKVDEMFAVLGPFAPLAARLKPTIVTKVLAGIEEMANDAIAHQGELDIGERIKAKINAMDIATLEELVLGFSRKQFRYITLFGGVLGALIGLIQATLNVFLGGR